MFATSVSLTGNPGIEWTYCNSTPATNTLTHTHKYKKEQQQGEKQFYDNILPSANPLAPGSSDPGPDHSILTYSMKLSVVSLPCYSAPLWLCVWRNQGTAPPEGNHLWHVNHEGRGGTLLNPDESDISGAASVRLRHLWVLLVTSLANLETHAWTYLTECLGKITRVLFGMMKQSPCSVWVYNCLTMENRGKDSRKKVSYALFSQNLSKGFL